MFKFTLLALLCSAYIAFQTPDFFDGCLEKQEHEKVRSDCVFVAKRWLSSSTYRFYAYQVLKNSASQPKEGNLNTVLNVTRASVQMYVSLHGTFSDVTTGPGVYPTGCIGQEYAGDQLDAALLLPKGMVIKVEFTTVKSACNNSVSYFEEQCPPLGNEANGLCQARFLFNGDMKLEYAKCIGHTK